MPPSYTIEITFQKGGDKAVIKNVSTFHIENGCLYLTVDDYDARHDYIYPLMNIHEIIKITHKRVPNPIC